jgi:hypothetical protein
LQSRCPTSWATPQIHINLVIWEMGEVSPTMCLGWPPATILMISAPRVARITGVSYHTRLYTFCFHTPIPMLAADWFLSNTQLTMLSLKSPTVSVTYIQLGSFSFLV